jgi:hypothetical protein
MSNLTPEGEKIVAALADRYSLGIEAVKMMLDAVARGGGTMAQFNLPEFGGSGQWMRGGMTMIGDMFNNAAKATVDNLCNDLSKLLEGQASLFVPIPMSQSQSQSQGGGEGVSLWQSSSQSGAWWPSALGNASATGSQNALRYAYFPGNRRLAIEQNGRVEVYDTTGYDIRGFAQQQAGDSSLTFMSQRGPVRLDSLPRERVPQPAAAPAAAAAPVAPSQPRASGDATSALSLIEQLGHLKEKGLLTEEEFAAKKAELLKRL